MQNHLLTTTYVDVMNIRRLKEKNTDVQVEARPVGAQQDQDDANVGDNDSPQNQEEVTSNNFLIFPTLVTPIAILWAALMRAREE